MVKQELVDRSPVRFFKNATNGGLKSGEIGALTSKKGLGKTSVLVQIGLDKLFQDKHVVHISFNQNADFSMTWYEDIFNEITKKKNIGNVADLKADTLKKRVILNFNQDSVSGEQIVNTLKALAAGGIATDCILIDGLDFTRVSADSIKTLKDYATEAGSVIWFGVSTDSENLKDMLPENVAAYVDAVIHLEQKPDAIEMKVLKLRDEKIEVSNLKLDSKTLLIAEK